MLQNTRKSLVSNISPTYRDVSRSKNKHSRNSGLGIIDPNCNQNRVVSKGMELVATDDSGDHTTNREASSSHSLRGRNQRNPKEKDGKLFSPQIQWPFIDALSLG